MKTIAVIGGGAAGFFAAIHCKQQSPQTQVVILEKATRVLQKVRISGGGRCNVTHACFEPSELVKFYPRGSRELLGPFYTFNPTHTQAWFKQHGVQLKAEADGRMFPVTDSSETIIDCFMEQARQLGVVLQTGVGVDDLKPLNNGWQLQLSNGKMLQANAVIIAAGSSLHVWKMLSQLGVGIVEPVPSLFTFNISDPRIKGLMGLSVGRAQLSIADTRLQANGPLLITHWGLSGPAVLRLSAWGAKTLHDMHYRFVLRVNFTGHTTANMVSELKQCRTQMARKTVLGNPLFDMPRRLWESLMPLNKNFGDLSNSEIEHMANELTNASFQVTGKSTFKDEFVTAGGVELSEVNFQTMEHKRLKGLYFAGEVLNIDGITGGFNFQAAWTTAFLAAAAASEITGS